MASTILATATSGGIFGAALAAAGVYSPTVIIDQLRLDDLFMLKVFLIAIGSSAILVPLARRLKVSECKPRDPSSLGWVNDYDGNIIGGLLFGFGMALSGACPGTVLVQIGAGIRSGHYAAAGAIVGGILYSRYSQIFKRNGATQTQAPKPLTVFQRYDIKEIHAILAFEAACVAVVGLASWLKPETETTADLLPPLLGGLVMGASQAASLLLTRSTLGISSAYSQCAQWFWHLVDSSSSLETTKASTTATAEPGPKPQSPPFNSIVFAAGVLVGGWAVASAVPLPAPQNNMPVSAVRAFVGGVLLIVGARLAGGCTSGHGISGMATLSTSSFITVAAMFAGGMGLIPFLP